MSRKGTADDYSKSRGDYDGPAVHDFPRIAPVESINDDGSFLVSLNGKVATRCSAFCDADAGDKVLVVKMGNGTLAATGRLR